MLLSWLRLISLWCAQVAVAAAMAFLVVLLGVPESSDVGLERLLPMAWPILAGAVGGTFLVGLQRHPTRVLGLVPLGTTGLFVLLIIAALVEAVPAWSYILFGMTSALTFAPLLRNAAHRRGIVALVGASALAFFGLMLAWLISDRLSAGGWLWLLASLAGIGVAGAWWALLRDAYDQTIEWLFWPLFRVRGDGPGLDKIPRTGPLLVIANHTAWFDPVWLGKVLPRRLTGMLTSVFFDRPGLHFLATKVVHAIRVENSRYRREAPELTEAIARLDRGEAILLFPEGQMRKKEEKPLHPFGRGVWHILHERPQTPVVVCWIEGAWGSFTSYKDGPPTKNKRFDLWRHIDVAVGAPEVLDPALLEDHRATRNYLMRKVSEARHYLGLEPLRPPEVVHSDKSSDV